MLGALHFVIGRRRKTRCLLFGLSTTQDYYKYKLLFKILTKNVMGMTHYQPEEGGQYLNASGMVD